MNNFQPSITPETRPPFSPINLNEQELNHEHVYLGTGECSMCDCKAYDEKDSLLKKCQCGHRKMSHL